MRKNYEQLERLPYNPYRICCHCLAAKYKQNRNKSHFGAIYAPDRYDRYNKELLKVEWDIIYWRGSRAL